MKLSTGGDREAGSGGSFSPARVGPGPPQQVEGEPEYLRSAEAEPSFSGRGRFGVKPASAGCIGRVRYKPARSRSSKC